MKTQLLSKSAFPFLLLCLLAPALCLAVPNLTVPPAIPISFERNQGQVPGPVQFLARGEGYRLYLGQDQFEVVLLARTVCQSEIEFGTNQSAARSVSRPRTAVLHATLADACPGAGPEPIRASSAVNYFLGNDSSTWLRDIPAFEKVQYRGVYPGIDLVFYGNQQSLEYDFIVSPGSDPEQIVLQFRGAESAVLDGGDLVLRCATGDFRHHRPVLYQIRNGRHVPVQGEYVLSESKFDFRLSPGSTSGEPAFEVRFQVGKYDHQAFARFRGGDIRTAVPKSSASLRQMAPVLLTNVRD